MDLLDPEEAVHTRIGVLVRATEGHLPTALLAPEGEYDRGAPDFGVDQETRAGIHRIAVLVGVQRPVVDLDVDLEIGVLARVVGIAVHLGDASALPYAGAIRADAVALLCRVGLVAARERLEEEPRAAEMDYEAAYLGEAAAVVGACEIVEGGLRRPKPVLRLARLGRVERRFDAERVLALGDGLAGQGESGNQE